METNLLSVLREARSALGTATTAEPGEAAVARKLARELDLAIARLRGQDEKDLMSIICHDLKDPLASIVMGAGYLKKTMSSEGEEARSARRVVEAIARSADRMSQVIGDFHDLSKLETGALEIDVRACDVVATVRGTIGSLEKQASERSVVLSLDAPAEPVVALCDPARVLQIVAKLAHNATKFTPPGGHVTVSVAADAKAARISVRDTGRGVPPEIVNEIFDHAANARRSPREGPGLGLAIARGLVELQGGLLTVESRAGEGSTFTFTLPRSGGQV
jgi:signal transduction histidine kinase